MYPEISVIVPIYNMASKLPICIESIVAQTFQDYEVILVDDGSTDQSVGICDKYCNNYASITAIHKANKGLPKARETGVCASHGKYICFIDADDYVEKNYLDRLYAAAKQEDSDMVCCGFYVDYPHHPSKNIAVNVTDQMRNVNDEQFIEILHTGRGRWHFMWNKLFRKECFENVIFPPQHTMYEDYFIMIQMVPFLNKITLIPEQLYHYVQSGQNMTNAGFGKTYEYGISHLLDSQKKLFQAYGKSASYITNFRLRLEMSGIATMTRNKHYDYPIAKYVQKDVRRHFSVLWHDSYSNYAEKIGALCLVLSIRLFWFAYIIYGKIGKVMNNQKL